MGHCMLFAWALLITLAAARVSHQGLQASSGPAENVHDSRSTVRGDAAQTAFLRSRKVDATLHSAEDIEWKHVKQVYCSDNWDLDHAVQAKESKADTKTCKQRCLDDRSCIGVSVTNANWGKRDPWCHLCRSSATKTHQNFDTYWKSHLSPLMIKERQLETELQDVKDIEYDMCRSPEKVDAERFKKAKNKGELQDQLRDSRSKLRAEEEKELDKLQTQKKHFEGEIEQIEYKCEKVERDSDMDPKEKRKTLQDCESRKSKNKEGKEECDARLLDLEVSLPKRLLVEEAENLEHDIDRINRLEKDLAKEKALKEKLLQKVNARRKQMGKKEEEAFWADWLNLD